MALFYKLCTSEKIKEFGVECDVIDYRNRTIESLHKKKIDGS